MIFREKSRRRNFALSWGQCKQTVVARTQTIKKHSNNGTLKRKLKYAQTADWIKCDISFQISVKYQLIDFKYIFFYIYLIVKSRSFLSHFTKKKKKMKKNWQYREWYKWRYFLSIDFLFVLSDNFSRIFCITKGFEARTQNFRVVKKKSIHYHRY